MGLGECEICRSCGADLEVRVPASGNGILAVCQGCQDSTGYSEGWKPLDDDEFFGEE